MIAPTTLAPIAIGPAASGLTPPGPDRTLGYAVVQWCERWLDHPETDERWEFTGEQLQVRALDVRDQARRHVPLDRRRAAP